MESMKFSKTMLKNLLKKPVTTQYPYEPKTFFEGSRGHVRIDVQHCIFCGICGKKCPSAAIEIKKLEKEWTINRMKCIQCNACIENCPKKCLFMEPQYTKPHTKETKESYHA